MQFSLKQGVLPFVSNLLCFKSPCIIVVKHVTKELQLSEISLAYLEFHRVKLVLF